MKKVFVCSLCVNGIVGGNLVLTENSLFYRTNKLTVNPSYRYLELPIDQIEDVSWECFLFPAATFHMKNHEEYRIIIFNKKRFLKCFQQLSIRGKSA